VIFDVIYRILLRRAVAGRVS